MPHARLLALVGLLALTALAGCTTPSTARSTFLEEDTLRRSLVRVTAPSEGPRPLEATGVVIGHAPGRAVALVGGVDLGARAAAAGRALEQRRARAVPGALAGGPTIAAPGPAAPEAPVLEIALPGGGTAAGRVVGHDPHLMAWVVAFDPGEDRLHALFPALEAAKPESTVYAVPPLAPGEPLAGRLAPVAVLPSAPNARLALGGEALRMGSPLLDRAGALAGFAKLEADGSFGLLSAPELLDGPVIRWVLYLDLDRPRERRSGPDSSPLFATNLPPRYLHSDELESGDRTDHLELTIDANGDATFVLYRRDPDARLRLEVTDLNGVEVVGLADEAGARFTARRVFLAAGRYRLRVRAPEDSAGSAYHLIVTTTPRRAAASNAERAPAGVQRRGGATSRARRDPQELEVAFFVTELALLAEYEEEAARPSAAAFIDGAEAVLRETRFHTQTIAEAAVDQLGSDSALARRMAMALIEPSAGNIEPLLWDLVSRAETVALGIGDEGLPGGLKQHGRDPERLKAQGRAAGLVLAKRHPRDRRLHEAILGSAFEEDPFFRTMALRAAARSGDRKLVTRVVQALRDDPDAGVRDLARGMIRGSR